MEDPLGKPMNLDRRVDRYRNVYEHPILLVEDNPNDVLITERACKIGQIKNKLIVARDGEEALNFLYRRGKYSYAPRPCLILLDLKMPRMDGFEVLETVKSDYSLKKIPIIVLTTSERSRDVEQAYQLGCNNYIVKPVGFENFLKAVVEIKCYWLILCEIPCEA
jgi:CheY-like chemotaxis protein